MIEALGFVKRLEFKAGVTMLSSQVGYSFGKI